MAPPKKPGKKKPGKKPIPAPPVPDAAVPGFAGRAELPVVSAAEGLFPRNPLTRPAALRSGGPDMPPPRWVPHWMRNQPNKQNFINTAKASNQQGHEMVDRRARRMGVNIPRRVPGTMQLLDAGQRANRLIHAVRQMPDDALHARRRVIEDEKARLEKARVASEALAPAATQGRERNVHNRTGPESQSGILPVTHRVRPIQENENPVHAPGSGARQIIPPSAVSATVLGDPAAGLGQSDELRRRAAMLEAQKERERRAPKSVQMSGLESASDIESDVGHIDLNVDDHPPRQPVVRRKRKRDKSPTRNPAPRARSPTPASPSDSSDDVILQKEVVDLRSVSRSQSRDPAAPPPLDPDGGKWRPVGPSEEQELMRGFAEIARGRPQKKTRTEPSSPYVQPPTTAPIRLDESPMPPRRSGRVTKRPGALGGRGADESPDYIGKTFQRRPEAYDARMSPKIPYVSPGYESDVSIGTYPAISARQKERKEFQAEETDSDPDEPEMPQPSRSGREPRPGADPPEADVSSMFLSTAPWTTAAGDVHPEGLQDPRVLFPREGNFTYAERRDMHTGRKYQTWTNPEGIWKHDLGTRTFKSAQFLNRQGLQFHKGKFQSIEAIFADKATQTRLENAKRAQLALKSPASSPYGNEPGAASLGRAKAGSAGRAGKGDRSSSEESDAMERRLAAAGSEAELDLTVPQDETDEDPEEGKEEHPEPTPGLEGAWTKSKARSPTPDPGPRAVPSAGDLMPIGSGAPPWIGHGRLGTQSRSVSPEMERVPPDDPRLGPSGFGPILKRKRRKRRASVGDEPLAVPEHLRTQDFLEDDRGKPILMDTKAADFFREHLKAHMKRHGMPSRAEVIKEWGSYFRRLGKPEGFDRISWRPDTQEEEKGEERRLTWPKPPGAFGRRLTGPGHLPRAPSLQDMVQSFGDTILKFNDPANQLHKERILNIAFDNTNLTPQTATEKDKRMALAKHFSNNRPMFARLSKRNFITAVMPWINTGRGFVRPAPGPPQALPRRLRGYPPTAPRAQRPRRGFPPAPGTPFRGPHPGAIPSSQRRLPVGISSPARVSPVYNPKRLPPMGSQAFNPPGAPAPAPGPIIQPGPGRSVGRSISRYPSRRVAAVRTIVGSTVRKAHLGPHSLGATADSRLRRGHSVVPKLSWQHLAPGHYIAKAREGLTPGIRQHVLKLLNRAKGYIWINGKRHSLKRARLVIMELLGTRASVDIKIQRDFPWAQ